MVKLLNLIIKILMVAKNFKCTIAKDVFLCIVRIPNVVAHGSHLDNGPPRFFSFLAKDALSKENIVKPEVLGFNTTNMCYFRKGLDELLNYDLTLLQRLAQNLSLGSR